MCVILACAGCGERSAGVSAIPPSRGSTARGAALLPPPTTGNPFVPRPATWQDSRGFTARVDYHPDEILVRFADELTGEIEGDTGSGLGQPPINAASMLYANVGHARFARRLAADYGLSIIEGCEAYVAGFNYCGYRLPPGVEAVPVMQRLLVENPVNVRLVEYSPIYRPCYTPDDPKVQDAAQWYHDASHMDNFGAWDTQTGDLEVYVAVIDTGADMDHPDLVDNILDINSLWPGEDFDLGESDTWPQDTLGHGSHCCGIAAATGDNATGGAGVAYDGGILPIKVTNASGAFVGSISGIVLAVQCEASVISMSFGSYMPSETLKEVCEYAYLNGSLPVAAAGNDNNGAQIHYPAGIPVCIAVGAVESSDNKASFSNYGPWVDSVAPGVNIYSTIPNNTYAIYQGTSMAAPMVAGAALLLMAEYGDALSLDQIRGLIESTGDPVSDAQWRNDYVTRVNTANALAASAGTAPVVDITNLSNDQSVTGVVDIDCEVTDDGTIERAFLYIDGLLVDELDGPGSSFGFSYDATDEYPGEMNVFVEVVDDDFIHGYDERVLVVTDSFYMPIPYYNIFDGMDTSHWTQHSISGEAYWHLYEEAPGDFAMRLGDPALVPPKYRQRDVDWLFSPLFDLSGVENAKVVFNGDWSFSSGKMMMMAVYGESGGGYIDIYSVDDDNGEDGSFDYNGSFIQSLSSIVGSAVQFYWLLDGSDAGGQRWFEFDDFYLATPTELPLVLFNDPVEGQVVSGVVDLDLHVYDDHLWQVERCEVFVNGELYDTTYGPNWGLTLDTGAYPNGQLDITATAYEYDLYDNDDDGSLEDKVSEGLTLYVGHHSVTSVAPTEGFYYDPVTITGSGFGAYSEGETMVTFAGGAGRLEAPVQTWSDGSIEVLVPVGAVTGTVQVSLNGAVRESSANFTVLTPYDDFGFEFVEPPADLMFDQTFSVRVYAQPDLDSVTIRIAGAVGKEWNITTRGNENDIVAEVNIGSLTTGAYELEVEGFRGEYSETLSGMFYLNTLPGDYDSSGVVDDGDTAFLALFLAANGEMTEGTTGFLPFLDVNGDGFISEADAPFVGYHWGDVLE